MLQQKKTNFQEGIEHTTKRMLVLIGEIKMARENWENIGKEQVHPFESISKRQIYMIM